MSDSMDKLEQYLLQTGEINESNSGLLSRVAYDRLHHANRYVDLQPSEPLSETHITKALGISRTPVRTTLQQLAQEGLIQIIPGRAIYLQQLRQNILKRLARY